MNNAIKTRTFQNLNYYFLIISQRTFFFFNFLKNNWKEIGMWVQHVFHSFHTRSWNAGKTHFLKSTSWNNFFFLIYKPNALVIKIPKLNPCMHVLLGIWVKDGFFYFHLIRILWDLKKKKNNNRQILRIINDIKFIINFFFLYTILITY